MDVVYWSRHGLSCPKGTYITDYDIQGYVFPLIILHEDSSEVCACCVFLSCPEGTCMHASRDMRFPS